MQRAFFSESENIPGGNNDSEMVTNALVGPTLDLAALPTLKLTIGGSNRLRLERLDVARNVWTSVYDALQPAGQNRLLNDGFGLSLRVNTLGTAMALSFQAQMHVQIDSEVPIVLQDDFIVGGNLKVTAPSLSNTAKLRAESLFVNSPSFESTGSVHANGLDFKVHDLKVSGSLYSGGDCHIQHSGGAWELQGVEQCLQVGGRLSLDLKEGVDIGQKIEAGSAVYRVDALAVKPLRFLKEQTLEDVGIIGAPYWQNEAPLTARRLEVRTEHFNNQNTIQTEEGYLKSVDYTLVPGGSWHSRGDLQIDQADALMAHDFSASFQSLETLGVSLNKGCSLEKPLKFPGSLKLAILAQPSPAQPSPAQPSPAQPSPAQPLILLTDISVAKDCRIDSTPVVLGRVGQAARKAEGNQPEKPEMPEIYAHLSAGGHIHLQTQGGLAHIDQATKQAQTVGILLNRGRLCGGEAVHLQSETDMSLGALDTSTLLGASKPSAIYTKGPLTCDTPWHMQWHQLEVRAEALQVHAGYGYELALMSPGTILKKEILYLEKQGSSLQYTVLNGADLVTVGVISTTELPSLEGRLTSPLNLEILKPLLFDMVKILSDRDQIPVAFDNVSSRVIIKGNADLDVPLSKHRLLVEEKANGHRYACGGGSQDCHEIYRIAGPSKRALSAGAHWVVGGCLSTSGHTKLLGSQIQCASFKPGSTVPEKTTVVPFTSYTESELCGHRKRDKAQWHHSSLQMRPESPLEATYSVAGVLEAQSSTLKIEGFLSALAIDISGIKEGWIGHRLDLQLRLPSSKPFKPCLQLMDYFKPTACFEMQSGGDTVYQSLLSNRMPELRLDPIIVMNPDGTLSRSEPGIRFLLTLEQEEELLGTAFMEELKRGYLDADLREPTRVLSALKQGAARRMVEEDNNTQALALRRADATSIQEPLLCYYKAPLHDEQGVFVEEVYLPAMGLPKRFDNPRLRDGAGGLFGLGPVTLGGVDGSVLTITANIDAQGVVTFRHLNQVNHVRRTVTELQAITQEIRTSRLARSDKVSTRTEFVPVTHLEPGNEIVTSVDGGVVYDEVDTVFMSGLRTDVGEQGYTIRGAKQVVDAAIVRNVIGSTQTDRQRGLLGMGGSMTTYQPVTQQAIGSQIHSMGPVYIETELGIFEATNFGQSPATLQVRELHYHELLRAMEARDRDVAKQIREAKKTRKRKQRQGTMWFLISLPVSAYVGGLVSGWLQSAMGVTIKATVVNGVRVAATASFAQTVAIVGTAGAVSGGVAAAIQKQSILKGALNAAPFAIAGNLVANSPALANSGFMVQTLAQTAAASGLHAFLHGHLSLENLVVAFGAAVVAESVVPSSDNDSIGREVFRAATSTTVMALLGNGTIQSLATSLMAAGVGASAGRMAAQQGEQHGTVLHQHRVFKQELIRVSEHASQALAAQGIHVPAKQIKKQLQRHPALQGSPEEVQARLIRRGTIEEGDSIQTGAAASLARGVAWVLGATLDAIIPVAYASEFTPEERSRGYGYQDEHALQKIEYSLPPRVAPNTVLSGTEWLKEFGISASESAIAIKVITMMAQNPKLLRLVKVAGWVSAGMLVAEGMQLDAQFGRDHFDLTGDFDRIMRNPGISEARKQEMRSQSRQNLARLEGGKAKSLSQVIKDNPRPLGLVFGGMLGVKLKFPTISTPEPFPEVALVGNARSLTPSYQAHRARHSVTVPMSSMERDFYSKSELVGVFNYEHRGKLPHDIATTFMGDRYSTYQLKEDYLFYRSGAAERELGQFFSFEKPASVIQTRIDNALPLFWSDGKPCVINTAYTIKVPKGTIVHVGESTQQGGVFLGGTPQIVIEDPRLIDGLKVVEKFSLEEYQKYGKK